MFRVKDRDSMLQAFDLFDYEDSFDNSVAESFFGTFQLELLDEHRSGIHQQLASAVFDWIDSRHSPRQRQGIARW